MLINRYHNNPILTKDDVPYAVATVHNAGVVKFNDRNIKIFRYHTLKGSNIIDKEGRDNG